MASSDSPTSTTDLRTELAAAHLRLEQADAELRELRDEHAAAHRDWLNKLDACLNTGLTYTALGNDACYPRPSNL